ncbi:MAG: ZIP family metal transporter [Pseudomonadota bacterium]
MFFESEISNGLLASFIAGGISMLGLASVWAVGDWGQRTSSVFSAFAIGVLTVAVLFHLFPEAIEEDPGAWRYTLGAFGLMAMAGLSLRLALSGSVAGDREDPAATDLAFGFASIVALGFHSFVDGLVYESTFQGDEYTGWLATSALLLHEFPEGAIAYFLIRDSGVDRVWSLLIAFVASSLTTIAGALVAGFILSQPSAGLVGPLLGATAGALIYVIVLHLGPHALRARPPAIYLAAALGVVIATAAEVIRHSGGGHAH